MKPSPFAWSAPSSLDEALAVLARGRRRRQGARRRSEPAADAQHAARRPGPPRRHQPPDRAGHGPRRGRRACVVGALARHAAVERDEAAHGVQPLLRQALRLVAHPVIRNRGTTVGSIAHADPSGEMTAVLALTGGSVQVASAQGRRDVAADAFFTGPLESDLGRGRARRLGAVPGLPGRQRHDVRRGGPAARRLRGVRAGRRGDRRWTASSTSARAAYVSVAPTPAGAGPHRGGARRRAR